MLEEMGSVHEFRKFLSLRAIKKVKILNLERIVPFVACLHRVGASQLIDLQRGLPQSLLLALAGSEILPRTEDFDSAYGFSEVFPKMSDIAGQKVIGLDGNGSHKNRPVLFRQVERAGDVGVNFGDDLDMR
jgi:hypothetical protein